jgi:hypothetical protein
LHPKFFYLFIKNKKHGQYENFGIILVELKKIETLWGWIAKVATLVFELKNAVNFVGVNYNFPEFFSMDLTTIEPLFMELIIV